MAGSVNKVVLIGHLGRDPEVRQTSQGGDAGGTGKIVQLNVATTESWKDKTTGERKDKTEWHRVVIFNENLGTVAEKYLRKGSKVYLEGQLQTRKWTDATGQERYTTEIVISRFKGELVLLDSRGSSEQGTSHDDGYAQPGASPSYGGSHHPVLQGGSSASKTDVFDDDIPF